MSRTDLRAGVGAETGAENRWAALAALTWARTVMGFQFQSVAALGPDLDARLSLGPAVLGLLIGLYLLPGIFVALPGGWLGARVGERRLLFWSLLLMTVGGMATALADGAVLAGAGRVLAGIGAVIVNVQVTKMVTHRFKGREAPFATGILITSWPAGLALGLFVLPGMAQALGVAATLALPAILAALGAPLLLWGVRRDPRATDRPGAQAPRPSLVLPGRELRAALAAGGVWTFLNAGLVVVLAFVPEVLAETGMGDVAAARVASLPAWLIIPSLVAGGWLAGRIGHADATLAAGLLIAAGALLALILGAPPAPCLAVFGVALGPAAPLSLLLPARVVPAERRGLAMGTVFTCYYAGVAAAPPVAGVVVGALGTPASALWIATGLMLAALVSLAAFRRL